MRIITWNCAGAFRKKFDLLSEFDADIAIIQECENPAISKNSEYQEFAQNHIWNGDNKHKGLGIFARPEIDLKPLDWSDEYDGHSVKYFIPCLANEYQFIAVWTHRNKSPTFKYIGQFWKYLQINKDKFENIIIAGDFNSNKIWDKWDRWWNQSDVVKELEEIKIESLYHKFYNEHQGEESKPTYSHQWNENQPYHIDHVFASEKIASTLSRYEIGNTKLWLKHSDHVPIIFEF